MNALHRLAAALFATCLLFSLSPASIAASAAPKPPVMRLGDAVKPLAYELALTLVPTAPGFTGHVDIDVELQKPLDFFWLNATGLDVKKASIAAGGKTLAAQPVRGGEDFLGLRFASPVPAGKARLSIDYSGRFSTNETRGLFKQEENGEWYAFSQLEAVSARRAFPCFDEPHWKTPWKLTLDVRREHVAVANTPQVSEEEIGSGMKRVRFAPTLPLPTYLVAVGVGPFDVVDGGTAGVSKTALRYIVPKGRAADARYAMASTPRILALLEEYFGRPYPFPKLDSMAIPITVDFGAMENPGLITYRSSILLSKPEREDERFQQRYASIGAHEMAHQWFGDLVTMTWWNDVWLNESFATWMARKITQQFNPAWEAHESKEHERKDAILTDRLTTTRQIRQAVNTRDDLGNAFDRITYDKGGAVLTMFETWLGETGFRDGVRRYLKRHEFGNAAAEDFFAALADTDPELAKGFSSFVAQPGLPVVDFQLDCAGSKPAMRLRQRRFAPAAKMSGAEQSWIAPVCVRYAGQGSDKPFCTVLRDKEQRVELPEAKACPAWLLPNPGGAGYFLSAVEAANARQLTQASLSAPEAVALINDTALLVESGALPVERLLDMVGAFAADTRPEVGKAAAEAVYKLHPALFGAAVRDSLPAWVRAHFGPRAREIGWVGRADDSDATRKQREMLLPLVAEIGRDAALRTQARELALGWLRGTGPQLGSMFRTVLKTAAFDGDAALFDAMADAALRTDDSNARVETYKALGSFRDPALRERAFALALSRKVDVREAVYIYVGASEQPDNAQALLDFVRGHYAAMERRLPEETLARMPHWGLQLCAAAQRAVLQTVFQGRAGKHPGGARNLAQTLEAVDICIANRKAQEGSASGFLAAQKYQAQ